MPNIQKIESSFPSRYNLDIQEVLFGDNIGDIESIELLITIDDRRLNIKELSAYLDFIYQTDGYLSTYSFLSYSKMPRVQIEITEIRKGSILIVVERLLNEIGGQNLMIIFLVLKYLPDTIKATLDGAERYYSVLEKREDYLEKREARKFRSPLKKAIFSDDELNSMSDRQKEKLAKHLNKFYKKNNLAASRFAQKFIKSIELKPVRKKNSHS